MRTHWLSKVSGFSARSMKQVTQHSSSGCPRTQGSAKWKPDPKEVNVGSDAIWEILPIVTGHSEPEWGDTWTIQRTPPNRGPISQAAKGAQSHTSVPGKAPHAGDWDPMSLGSLQLKSSHFIATMSWKDGGCRTENSAWHSDAEKVSKGQVREKWTNSGILTAWHQCYKLKQSVLDILFCVCGKLYS